MKPIPLRTANIPLPYFDFLLEQLDWGEPMVQQAFSRHVHWGYWSHPEQADGSVEDFAIASERLCQRVIAAAGGKEGDRVLDVGCGCGGILIGATKPQAAIGEGWSKVILSLDRRFRTY